MLLKAGLAPAFLFGDGPATGGVIAARFLT
jgi:hypothetical protein